MSSTNTFFGLSSGSLVQLPHLDVLATTATTFILECAGLTARSLVLKEGSRLFCCSNVLPRLFVGGQPVEAQLPFKSRSFCSRAAPPPLCASAPRLSAELLVVSDSCQEGSLANWQPLPTNFQMRLK